MKRLSVLLALMASPALAATGPFFSLANTDFIVTLAFLVFVGILIYYKVPGIVGGLLDKRADGIRNDLAEARRLREEAQEIYASYERRQREVSSQADEIVANAKREATVEAEKAKQALQVSIERRLKAAEEQIAGAESDAVRAVRDRAIVTAVAAAAEILGKQSSAAERSAGIDKAIDEVAQRLN
ncbi:F-type H+-transporting ATPase subunit b [Paracoccus halophilus]|uniref:ATP synthase subunit b n=1 Tax=Paracoccus halophilus TaxID=376733 RepID=A0A099F3B0_9RHOB|nr:F0F1 ATP synthase subunit B [Paracoccus halophilus]KGJ04721.1 ATP F0F1 synthase subunit B [Paracoccus halophilus]SFA50825.1 F-type H+-transporting ATPase subunit b [Paracoccus halophilus]